MEHRYDPSARPPTATSGPGAGPAGWREVARRRVRRTTAAAGMLGVALTGLLGGLAAAGHAVSHVTTGSTASTGSTSTSPGSGSGSTGTGGASTASGSTSTGTGSVPPTASSGPAGNTTGAS